MYKLNKVCVSCQHSTCLHVLQVGHATCYNVLVILHFVYTEQVFLTTITYTVTYTGSSNYGNRHTKVCYDEHNFDDALAR